MPEIKKPALKSAGIRGIKTTIRLCIDALVNAVKESKRGKLIHFLRVIYPSLVPLGILRLLSLYLRLRDAEYLRKNVFYLMNDIQYRIIIRKLIRMRYLCKWLT